VLEEIVRLSCDAEKSRHARYLAVFQLVQRRDRELADPFDDLRRWAALRQLALIQSQELLSAEEFGRFSSQTRDAVQILRGAEPAARPMVGISATLGSKMSRAGVNPIST
jgi:hypothetical protein